jgi:hypothetical protein
MIARTTSNSINENAALADGEHRSWGGPFIKVL